MNKLFTNEKHYLTLNNYLKDIYHEKVFKVSLNGNFSCPNRDGKLSTLGCTFCSSKGSGDFAGKRNESIKDQFNHVKALEHAKWKDASYIAYFQANTNTYDTVDNLRKRFDQIVDKEHNLLDPKIKILSIATRPDCLSDDIIDYLDELNQRITLWVELGFQTSNELTASLINRGYLNEVFKKSCIKLHERNIKVIVHIINGLPNDNKIDMLNTINYLNDLPIAGIKIHMLHIIKDSPMGKDYLINPFKLLTLEEYVDIVINQIRLLRDDIVIHRITGDADRLTLIEPTWTLKKFVVMDEIDKTMRKNNYYQGDLYKK